MANDEISLETRASAAYVQGRLAEVLSQHASAKCGLPHCIQWVSEVGHVLNEWKQAEAALKAQPSTAWNYEARGEYEG